MGSPITKEELLETPVKVRVSVSVSVTLTLTLTLTDRTGYMPNSSDILYCSIPTEGVTTKQVRVAYKS
jgi:hypothetical protein